MARIQILPLPTQKAGNYERTPFIVILDQCNRADEEWSDETLETLKRATGAEQVLAHEATIDAPGSLTLTDEERDQLRDYLLTPRRIALGLDEDLNTLPSEYRPAV